MYTKDELIKGAAALGYSPVLVEAALKHIDKKTFTLEEAKEIVKEFAERPVS